MKNSTVRVNFIMRSIIIIIIKIYLLLLSLSLSLSLSLFFFKKKVLYKLRRERNKYNNLIQFFLLVSSRSNLI
uniref:Uncharacterized protein n=1 Tax=Phakopsora pachyrhizi TaxID=170000 RepID=A0A0S1MJY5_PHAPC